MSVNLYPFPFEFLDEVFTRIINEVCGVYHESTIAPASPPSTIMLE